MKTVQFKHNDCFENPTTFEANNGTAFGFPFLLIRYFCANIKATRNTNSIYGAQLGNLRYIKHSHFFAIMSGVYSICIFLLLLLFFFAKHLRSMSLLGDKFLNFQNKLSRKITNCTNVL